jgi:hypothetical protein
VTSNLVAGDNKGTRRRRRRLMGVVMMVITLAY